ncbi:MAG: DUF1178 family protein [Deltaproteobacteria bacterium]|jgi:hypothetical protein
MIVFDLLCICGFQFEGWFQDSDSFRKQQETGLLTCPECGGTNVHKILSPVAVHNAPAADSSPTADNETAIQAAAAANVLRQLQNYVRKNFEDVGPKLATEALKIHYGIEEPRNIRGITSPEEEKKLDQEGIKLLKIPLPPQEEESN